MFETVMYKLNALKSTQSFLTIKNIIKYCLNLLFEFYLTDLYQFVAIN